MIKNINWTRNYEKLDPNNQLLVAETIANELKLNEKYLEENEYDHKKSKIVRELFSSILKDLKKPEEFNKFDSVFKKFDDLSLSNKRKLINVIYDIVCTYVRLQEQENKETICKNSGHLFGNWVYNKWTNYIDAEVDNHHVHNLPIERQEWTRICSRCGHIETVQKEPQELVQKRNEELERRLKLLSE